MKSDAADSKTLETDSNAHAYWRTNLKYLGLLLSIWFTVSFGCGVLFVEQLNQIRIPGTGFKLGFWFAQQGSIYTFVALIFVYAFLMNRLDVTHGVAEGTGPAEADNGTESPQR